MPHRIATLTRTQTSSHGTEGQLDIPEYGFHCFTLELPWRDNEPCMSCIPAGEYQIKVVRSPRFGRVYTVTNVFGRSHILIHSGNLAGDIRQGLKSNVEGCILLGEKKGYLSGQRAVLLSRKAVRRLMDATHGDPLHLIISDTGE